MKTRTLLALLVVGGLAAAGYETGLFAALKQKLADRESKAPAAEIAPPPAVSVVPVAIEDFVETVLVTGSLVPRDEILVAPEVASEAG